MTINLQHRTVGREDSSNMYNLHLYYAWTEHCGEAFWAIARRCGGYPSASWNYYPALRSTTGSAGSLTCGWTFLALTGVHDRDQRALKVEILH